MQVLQGLNMDVIPPVSSIILTPDMAVGGLSLRDAEAHFQKSVPGILDVVRQVEDRLSKRK